MEIVPSVKHREAELLLRRFFIPASAELPTSDLGVNIEELLHRLDKTETIRLLQDETVSPGLSKSATASPPAVRQAVWSPLATHYKSRCLLGVLTNKGGLQIYRVSGCRGESSVSVSALWHGEVSRRWPAGSLSSLSVSQILVELRRRAYQIKISAFAWGSCSSPHGTYDFFTGTMDGTVGVWSVSQDLNSLTTSLRLRQYFQTDREYITSLTSYYLENGKYIIFIGYIDGTIKSLSLDISSQEEPIQGMINGSHDLWSTGDRLEVKSGGLHCFKQSSSTSSGGCLSVYALKGFALIILYVDFKGQLISKEEDAIILPDLFISGFIKMSDESYLISTDSGCLHLLTNRQKQVTLSKVNDSLIKTTYFSCFGLAKSKNSTFFVLATSVKCNYDTNIMREFGHMIWFVNGDIPKISVPGNSLPLSSVWDLLEAQRMEAILSSDSTLDCYTSEDIDKLEVTDLKYALALLQISMTAESLKQNMPAYEKEEREKEIKDLIVSHHIFQKISYALEQNSFDEGNLNRLKVMRKWLNYLLEHYSAKYVQTVTTASALADQIDQFLYKDAEEFCFFCGTEVEEFTRWDAARCKGGHSAARCSLSLQQCLDLPYFHCRRCNVIALSGEVNETSFNCIFCDGTLKMDDNILREEELNPSNAS